MSKIYSWLFFISIPILLSSCGKSDEFLKGEDQILYKAQKKLKYDGLLYSAKMKASYTSDTLVLELTTKNVGDKPAKLNLMQAELMGQNGVRSNVIVATTPEKVLREGETTIDTIYFSPVNDMNLYNNTDMKGAYDNEYFLLPGAVGGVYFSSANIKLTASEKSFDGYKALKPYENVTFYDVDRSEEYKDVLLKNTTDLVAYTTKEQLQKDTAESSDREAKVLNPDVKISRKEILVTGIASLVKMYGWNDEIIVNWRMLNHQGADLKIEPEQFRLINEAGEELQPDEIQMLITPASWQQEKNRLLKGERIAIQMSFKSQNAEKLTLKTDIRYTESEQLIGSVPFKKFIQPSQE